MGCRDSPGSTSIVPTVLSLQPQLDHVLIVNDFFFIATLFFITASKSFLPVSQFLFCCGGGFRTYPAVLWVPYVVPGIKPRSAVYRASC